MPPLTLLPLMILLNLFLLDSHLFQMFLLGTRYLLLTLLLATSFFLILLFLLLLYIVDRPQEQYKLLGRDCKPIEYESSTNKIRNGRKQGISFCQYFSKLTYHYIQPFELELQLILSINREYDDVRPNEQFPMYAVINGQIEVYLIDQDFIFPCRFDELIMALTHQMAFNFLRKQDAQWGGFASNLLKKELEKVTESCQFYTLISYIYQEDQTNKALERSELSLCSSTEHICDHNRHINSKDIRQGWDVPLQQVFNNLPRGKSYITKLSIQNKLEMQQPSLYITFLFLFFYKSITMSMSQYLLNEDNELTKGSQETYPEIDRIGPYPLISRIAKSGQATIYLSKKEGRRYALKVYESTPKNDRIFQNEVHTLSKIQLRGIVPMEECLHKMELVTSSFEDPIICNAIVMPYIEKGDLLEWVLTRKRYEERAGRYFALQIFARFRYLQSKNIFHRDIKAENILIGDDYRPLLIDFGLATDSNQVARNFAGTARYASPEVVKEKEYTSKSEIYSLGILFFFILTGSYPYNIAKITDPGYRLLIELKFQRFWVNFELKQHIKLSDSFKQLFVRMVDHNPSKRPSLDELLQFEWFRQDSMTYEQFTAYMQAKDQCFQ